MGDPEIVDAARGIESNLKTVAETVGDHNRLFEKWDNDEPFVDMEHHLNPPIRSSAPNAGDLDAGAIEFGDGTGPNGRDELFWSVDGVAVARVEADSIIS